jgi:hypothetical protein
MYDFSTMYDSRELGKLPDLEGAFRSHGLFLLSVRATNAKLDQAVTVNR